MTPTTLDQLVTSREARQVPEARHHREPWGNVELRPGKPHQFATNISGSRRILRCYASRDEALYASLKMRLQPHSGNPAAWVPQIPGFSNQYVVASASSSRL
jgi:hypothetical protein